MDNQYRLPRLILKNGPFDLLSYRRKFEILLDYAEVKESFGMVNDNLSNPFHGKSPAIGNRNEHFKHRTQSYSTNLKMLKWFIYHVAACVIIWRHKNLFICAIIII